MSELELLGDVMICPQAVVCEIESEMELLGDVTVCPQAVVCEIESEMELLGATGVEDRLQEGVPDTLETMRAAGIKVGRASERSKISKTTQ